MNKLDVKIMPGIYVNDEKFDIEEALKSENDYIPISLDITNISKIICNIMMKRELINPKDERDLTLMRLIYNSDLNDIYELGNLLIQGVSKLDVNNENDLDVLSEMEELFERLCELNLYDQRIENNKKSKQKIKRL